MTAEMHRNPPFRAEHLGSLLRPNDLLQSREAVERGAIGREELTHAENAAVKEIVDTQLKLGFHGVSDGEYRRHSKHIVYEEHHRSSADRELVFWGSFFPGLEGFKEVKNPDAALFRPYMPDIAAFLEEGHGPVDSVFCVGKIKHVGSTYLDQWNYLKSIVPKEYIAECKLTLAAPEWYHMRYKEGNAYPKDVYQTDGDYFADIAAAYQAELQTLYDHGLRNVQIDDPNLACKSPISQPLSSQSQAKRNGSFLGRLLLRENDRQLGRRPPQHQDRRRATGRLHRPLQRLHRPPTPRHAHRRAPLPRQLCQFPPLL